MLGRPKEKQKSSTSVDGSRGGVVTWKDTFHFFRPSANQATTQSVTYSKSLSPLCSRGPELEISSGERGFRKQQRGTGNLLVFGGKKVKKVAWYIIHSVCAAVLRKRIQHPE